MAALESQCAHDVYDVSDLSDELDGLCSPVRARWRWYSIDLLGVVDGRASQVERATVLAAVRGLARRGHLDTVRTAYPYTDPFGGYLEDGRRMGRVDLAELREVDSRWPAHHGRRVWFRRRPPATAIIPVDDQISVLALLRRDRPEAFEDFAATLDRRQAWSTPMGHLLAWLLCGNTPSETWSAGSALATSPGLLRCLVPSATGSSVEQG